MRWGPTSGESMKSQLISVAALSATLALGACAYDPHHYGPAYGYTQGYGNEYSSRDRFGDGVDVERDGDTLNVRILGDVLFRLDSARLRPQARALIRSITSELMYDRVGNVEVNGFTDTSGTFEHNEILSQERANAVADELVRNGIDPQRIRAQGFGEIRLAVPTPDGVRERQNRRVEIVLTP
jgi:outer membrane protein OmpA-like peptidoglycan-associated protein